MTLMATQDSVGGPDVSHAGHSHVDRTETPHMSQQLTVLISSSHTHTTGTQGSGAPLLPSSVALGAPCISFCPVPGRWHRAPSYSGAGRSGHYGVGDPSAGSRDRITTKATTKEGTRIRTEKERGVKESNVVNSEKGQFKNRQVFY